MSSPVYPVNSVFTRDARFLVPLIIAIAAWTVFTGWNGYTFFSTAFHTADPHAVNCDNQQSMLHNWNQFTACKKEKIDSLFNPAVVTNSFWGLVSALAFGAAMAAPLSKLKTTRLTIGGTALAMMIGRLFDTGFDGLLGAAFSFLKVPQFLLFFITPFTLLFTGGMTLFLGLSALASFLGVLIGVPSLLFNQILQFESTLRIHRYETGGLSGYIVRFVYWLQRKALPDTPPDDSRGARLATMPEIIKAYRPEPESMAFGHLGSPLLLKTDKHILIMASTRSGKGVTLIIPHLLRYEGSAFVLDPKGENARATGRQRAELNGAVHYLDPFGISGKPQSRFNPLSRFTPANMEAESKALASALFVVRDQHQDHWTAAGQQLLASIILFVYVSADIPKDKKDLPTVRRLLLGNLKPTLEAMTLIDEADGLLRDLAISFMETPEREFGSVVSTTQRQTEILDNPYIIACLSATGQGSEVDFKAWHKGTMTVYLCLSAPKFPTFNRWLRLVLTSALDDMTDTLNPPRLPVCFMLDELATLGHLSAVENAVGLAAGYGIQLVCVFQDVAQMRDLYKGRWASFIGNAGVRALFNLDDYETAEYWSKFMGGNIVSTYSRQEDAYGQSSGQNVGEAMRPLFPPDKIMMDFASGKMLVLAQGLHPIITDRVPYWKDETLKGSWDDPRSAGSTNPGANPPKPDAPPEPPAPQPPQNPAPPDAPRPAPPNGAGAQAAPQQRPAPKPQPAPEPAQKPVFKGTPAQLAEALRQFGAAKADAEKAPQTPKPAPVAPIIDMEALAADIARMKKPGLNPYRVTIKVKSDDRERD